MHATRKLTRQCGTSRRSLSDKVHVIVTHILKHFYTYIGNRPNAMISFMQQGFSQSVMLFLLFTDYILLELAAIYPLLV